MVAQGGGRGGMATKEPYERRGQPLQPGEVHNRSSGEREEREVLKVGVALRRSYVLPSRGNKACLNKWRDRALSEGRVAGVGPF